MGYEIVKSISHRKKDNKIFITSASNNVWPKTYSRWEFIDIDIINVLKNKLFFKYDVSINKDTNSYSLLINKVINKIEVKEIENYVKTNYSFGVSRNLSKGFTKITIWNNKKEKKI